MTKFFSSSLDPLGKNISLIFQEIATLNPKSSAIIAADGEWTYEELERRVERYAHLLSERGVKAGDRVACIISDERSYLTVYLAAARLCAPVMPIPRSSTPIQRSTWMNSAGIKFLVTDGDAERAAPGTPTIIEVKWLQTAKPSIFRAAIQMQADFDPRQAIFMIAVGSGTTGRPKLMPITHAQAIARAMTIRTSLKVTPQDRLATMAHFEYTGGIYRLLCALFSGGGFVILDLQRRGMLEWHSRLGLTVLTATPFHAYQMLREVDKVSSKGDLPLDGIRMSLSSAVVTEDLRKRIMTELCQNLSINYATNEASWVTFASTTDLYKFPATVGRPIAGVDIKILDEEMKPLPIGEIGLIAVKSDQVILGYIDDAEANQKAFRNGWFLPGDLGYFTNCGQLIFCGRSDNMIIFNGINIYPIEIEQCLLSHADVADVVAMPARHAIHQDVPLAIVALHNNARISEDQLRQYAANILGPKQPRRVIIANDIPRNERGKPIKAELVKIITNALSKNHSRPTPPLRDQIVISFVPMNEGASRRLVSWVTLLNEDYNHDSLKACIEASRDGEAAGWLRVVLDLWLGLLQAARIPLFDPIKVVDCKPTEGTSNQWRATCLLPDPELVSGSVIPAIIKEAFKLAEWACSLSVDTPANREEFFSRVKTGALEILKTAGTRGKSTFELLRVAHGLSIPFRPLAGGVFQLGWGSNSRRIDRSTTDNDSAIGLNWTRDKYLTARMLREAGLPAPVHSRASSFTQAQDLARQIGYPVVVKPTDRERGEGVTVDVVETTLANAYEVAQKTSPGKAILIERQAPGVCHRLFIVCGQLLYAVKRLPIGVYGDGRSSVNELVIAECAAQHQRAPWRRSGIQPLDSMALDMLRQQSLEPSSVPPMRQFVALRRIETTAWGGVDEDVTDIVHSENTDLAIRATRLLGLEVAGVDIISQDISKPWHSNQAIINEVNYAPLLGGGDISRQHIKGYLAHILKDNGKIPVDTVVGGEEVWKQGLVQWQNLIDSGVKAHLTSAKLTLDEKGNVVKMVHQTLNSRVQALLMQKNVGALIIVAQSELEARSVRALYN